MDYLLKLIFLFIFCPSLQARERLVYQIDEVPANVRAEIEKKGCTIPKLGPIYRRIQSGIIKGDFSSQTKDDFAFLCKKDQFSKIVVIWSEGSPCPSEIHKERDDYFKNERLENAYSRNLRRESSKGLVKALKREKSNGKLRALVPVHPVTKKGKTSYVETEIYGGDMRKEVDNNAKIDLSSLRHDGIIDAYLDRGSIITFCYQGKWHKTRGATQ